MLSGTGALLFHLRWESDCKYKSLHKMEDIMLQIKYSIFVQNHCVLDCILSFICWQLLAGLFLVQCVL